ncbi:hypothetical protein [Dyadobacter crusticola]|uniref:hypothetical protein n=1 Tax=Dyadobacter crusticola TaxID=292407 RepID=UPI0004E14F09|nr:hypothetical protein [Dyadobacter crusticola]
MKNDSFLQAIFFTLYALFFLILEGIYQALRFLLKWLLVAIVLTIKAGVFTVLLPYSLYKCGKRAVGHRSFAAAGQLMKWIWIDYWKTTKL